VTDLAITALAAGGDGVGRDDNGRVTFVPRSAPGDRVRVRIAKQTRSFARADVVEVLEPSPSRVTPPCPHFVAGCGGCAWQHVDRPAQLAAKQAIVAGALRKLDVRIHPIADPAPAYGWRRRARFHVADGQVGLYAYGTRELVPIAHCPQLVPALDAALAGYRPQGDGELALLLAADGTAVVTQEQPGPVVEVEPGLWLGPWDFAQASADGNRALIELVRAALPAPGRALELYAGAGNFTRALVADGWDVTPSDVVPPSRPPPGFERGSAAEVLARVAGPFDAIVLDPPRTGAADAIAGIVHHGPKTIVYVSCDPATLARDAERLVTAGYRATDAWPVDVMPQTAHVEVVLVLAQGL